MGLTDLQPYLTILHKLSLFAGNLSLLRSLPVKNHFSANSSEGLQTNRVCPIKITQEAMTGNFYPANTSQASKKFPGCPLKITIAVLTGQFLSGKLVFAE